MIDRLPSGKFRATVYVARRGGVRSRISKVFSTRKEAKLWESQKELEKSQGKLSPELGETATFFATAKRYLDDELYSKSPNTIINYKAQMRKHVLDELGHIQLRDITPRKIMDFQIHLIEKGLKHNQVNYVIKIINSVFEYATSGLMQLSIKNPVKAVKMLKVQKSINTKKYLSENEISKLIDYLDGNHYKDFIVFLINSGLRISEASALQSYKFNEKRKTLMIDQQFHPYIPLAGEPNVKNAFALGPVKNCSPREIHLNYTSCKILERNIKTKDKDEFIFKPKNKGEQLLRKIVTSRGKNPKVLERYVINSKSYGFNKEIFKKILAKAGINTKFSVHNLRDTFATHFYKKTKDLYALKKILGHLSIGSTQIYADILDDSGRINANKFEVRID